VNYAKTYFTGAFPEVWLFALGGLFILVTLFAPNGIIGLFKRKPKQHKAEPEVIEEAKS
jgi:urea transport system permease protein